MRTCGFALCACVSLLTSARALADVPAERDDTPLPARPRQKGLVLETSLGALGFAGKFGSVAPTAFFMRTAVGYELLSWLMLFVDGELAFTDTSGTQDASHSRAFPIWGVGGGARLTWHPRWRPSSVGLFAEVSTGALTAYVPHGALAELGFSSAESLGGQFGGRVGIDWYMGDRHFALCLAGGPRAALGFAKQGFSAGQNRSKEGAPLMWDIEGGVRYTF